MQNIPAAGSARIDQDRRNLRMQNFAASHPAIGFGGSMRNIVLALILLQCLLARLRRWRVRRPW